jgi:hypothetical protein
MRGTMRSYGPTRSLDHYDTQAILFTGYYTSRCIQLESMLPDALHCMLHAPIYALKYAPDCTRLHTPSLLDLRSQVSSQDAPKYTPSTLPSTPPSTFSSTLLGVLARRLPIALDGTLPAGLIIRSQVSSHDALKHTPEPASKYTLPRQDTPNLT